MIHKVWLPSKTIKVPWEKLKVEGCFMFSASVRFVVPIVVCANGNGLTSLYQYRLHVDKTD